MPTYREILAAPRGHHLRRLPSKLAPLLASRPLCEPASARQGQTISVSSTVRNAGGATSPAIPLRFYLTTGTEPGSGDVPLGTRMIGALAINGASAAATSLVIPVSVNPGDYRILAVVDPDDAVAERNESNNFRVSSPMPVTLYRPDLTLTALKVPAAAQSGRPLAIKHTVHNAGPAPASASVMTFFIVSDATADSVLLGTRTLGALSGNGTSTLTASLPIPASLPVPAAYHVMAVLDSAQQLTELDESNNTLTSSSIALTAYRPDLTVTDLVLPAKAQAGRPLAITHTVSNIGPAPAGALVIRFYLSTDDRLDTNDVLLGARSVAGRAAGASAAAITTVTVPAGTVVPASYRVIAVADALEQQVELDESNNVMVSAPLPFIAYRPEILITALGSPAVVQAGRPMVISHTVRNAGPAAAGPFVIRFFLSADDTPDAGDLLLGTRAVGGLGAGLSSAAVMSVTVPATVATGTYRIVAVADAAGQQAELDETNDVAPSSPLTVSR